MAIFTTILKFFGFAREPKEGNTNQSKSPLNEQIDKSISDFLKRPIHKILTLEIIDSTSNDKLLQVVYDNLITKLSEDYKLEYQTVIGWSKPRQAIYLIWGLEAQVNNGGYNQFYYNSTGQFYKLLPDALRLVGANKFAELTENANKTFEEDHEEITKEQDGTLEGFSKSYEDDPLDQFDTEFYKLYEKENLQQIQVDYIRNHKVEFIDK